MTNKHQVRVSPPKEGQPRNAQFQRLDYDSTNWVKHVLCESAIRASRFKSAVAKLSRVTHGLLVKAVL